MSIKSRLLTDNSYSVAKTIDQEFLSETFSKSVKKIHKIVSTLQSLEQEDKELSQDLSVFLLHYLVKGAKIPLLNGDRKSNLSYLEFLTDSNPKYFRSQGGSIVSMYMQLLKTGRYKFLFNEYGDQFKIRDSIQPIKNNQFRHYLEMMYDYQSLNPATDQQFAEEENQLGFIRNFKPSSKEPAFFDVSHLLSTPNVPVDPKTLSLQISKLKNAIRDNQNDLSNVKIGACAKLEDGQTIFILFNDHKLQGSKSFEDVSKEILDDEEEIKENKAHSGYFPDIIEIRRSILNNDLKAQDLIELYPFAELSPRSQENTLSEASNLNTLPLIHEDSVSNSVKPEKVEYGEVKQRFEQTVSRLSVMSKKSESEACRFYSQLFSKFITTIANKTQQLQEANLLNENSLVLINATLNEIDGILSAIAMDSSDSDYLQFLSEIDLLTEEIVLLLAIVKPFDQPLYEILNAGGINFTSDKAKKSSYVYSSGMNGFSQVLRGLRTQGGKEKLKVGYASTNYFEFRLEVLPRLKRVFNIADNAENPFSPINNDCDVFFLDIYPNEVTLPSVARVDSQKVVQDLLKARNGKPLTVVIDTSTSFFCGSEIQDLVDNFKQQIENGLLNIVVVNSLAKFSMAGLDKYTGGVVQTYNNPKVFKSFNDILIQQQSREKLSPEAERFFSLFFAIGHDDIHEYLDLINRNTQRLYERLAPKLQTPDALIRLAERESDKIPMLSFQFDKIANQLCNNQDNDVKNKVKANISTLLQYYIYALAKSEGLPLDVRVSFGFAHSNLNECWIALRLTVGIENDEILKKYENLFLKVNEELKKVVDDPLFLKLIQEKEGFYYEQFKKVDARKKILNSISSKQSDLSAFLNSVDNVILNKKQKINAVQIDKQEKEELGIVQLITNFVKDHPIMATAASLFGIGALSYLLFKPINPNAVKA